MPTFFLTDEEVRDLTAYFEALAPQEIQYEAGIHVQKHLDSIEAGVKIVNYMDCGKCHDEGEKGIDFSIAGSRLRQEWIPRWLKDTRALIPWTKMPSHWNKEGEKYLVKTKFSEALWNQEENLERFLRNIPLRRIGKADDIAGLAVYLASDASAYCTGGIYMIDGGYAAS